MHIHLESESYLLYKEFSILYDSIENALREYLIEKVNHKLNKEKDKEKKHL